MIGFLTSTAGRVVLGAVALFGGYKVVQWGLERRALRDPSKCPSARTDCPPVSGKTPNPDGGAPVPGRASALDYPWCHRVSRGESPGSIANEITGDPARYREILAANPHKPTMTTSAGEVNFSSFCVGEKITLPASFNPWIDQTGAPRRGRTAFPPYDTLPAYPAVSGISLGHVPGRAGRWTNAR